MQMSLIGLRRKPMFQAEGLVLRLRKNMDHTRKGYESYRKQKEIWNDFGENVKKKPEVDK